MSAIFSQSNSENRTLSAIFSAESGAFLNRDCYGYIPYMQLCVCSYRLGELEQARKYHMLAAELKPEDPAVKHNGAFFASLEQGGGKG